MQRQGHLGEGKGGGELDGPLACSWASGQGTKIALKRLFWDAMTICRPYNATSMQTFVTVAILSQDLMNSDTSCCAFQRLTRSAETEATAVAQ